MLIKEPTDIASSEITPKKLYLNRRKLLVAVSAMAGVAALGEWRRAKRDRQQVGWRSPRQMELAPKLMTSRRAR